MIDAPPPGSIRIGFLGQAGVALRGEADLVLIDPFLSPRPERLVPPIVDPGELTGVSAVLATHEHGDHLDVPTWTRIADASPDARFVVPEPLVPLVREAGIAADRIAGARPGTPLILGGLRVTAVPARHGVWIEDGYSLGDDPPGAPRWVGYVVEIDGVRLYHAGDSLADPAIVGAVQPLRPEIAFLPINGRDPERERRGIVGNMTPDEAAQLALELGVRLAVPIHFDTIRGNEGSPGDFIAALSARDPRVAVFVPAAGVSLTWPPGGTA